MTFRNRSEAGRLLAERLRRRHADQHDLPVLAEAGGPTTILTVPPEAPGVVLFAHRNVVADALDEAGIGTLRVDLLNTPDELLSDRFVAAVDWLTSAAVVGDVPLDSRSLRLGCFGAGAEAAAVLTAAAKRPDHVCAVVACGPRDLLGGGGLAREPGAALLMVDDLLERPGAFERIASLAKDWFEWHLRP
jgi:putative phosphoribosyl transferase